MRQITRRLGRQDPRKLLGAFGHHLRGRVVAATLAAVLSLLVYANFFADKNTYVISHDDGITVHATYTQDPRIVLMEAGIHIGEYDYVSLPEGLVSGEAAEIEIIRAKTVTVALDGKTHELITLGGTVADALARLGYQQGDHDVVTPDRDRLIEDGLYIEVTRFALESLVETIYLPFDSTRVTTESLEPGEERVAVPGKAGVREIEYLLTLQDGEEVGRQTVRDEVVSGAVTEIIEVGAEREEEVVGFPGLNAVMPVENGGTLILPDGSRIAYTHTMKAVATAYTTERQKNKINASGKVARVGTIAVDPRVIPLGSVVYVVAYDGTWVYGTAVCEDTGGVIKGNIIDLYFDKYDECINFGRRAAMVYILQTN